MLSLTLVRQSIRNCSTSVASIAVAQKIVIIRQVTGLKTTQAKRILNDFSIKGLSNHPFEHFRRISEIFGNQKLASCTSSEMRDLFTTSYSALRHRIQFLKSCGIVNMNANHILNLNFFMDTNLNIFKAVTNLDPGTTFVDKWMSVLDESSQKEASRVLKGFKNPNSLLISQIRNTIFACHLASRWDLPYTEALKIVESGVKNQPYALERLIETLDTLQEKGFDKATISEHPEVLGSESKSICQFLDVYSKDFLGQPGLQFLKDNPALASTLDFDILHENLNNLLQAEIPIEVIRSHALTLLNYDPYILADRLESFSSFPELIVFTRNPNFPALLENMESVIIRMETLRSIDTRLINFRLLTCRSEEFMKLIHSAKIPFVLSMDVLRYLEAFTGESMDNIRKALSTHPHYRHLTVGTMKGVVDLLVHEKFTPEQIFEGLHLILYPAELVRKKLAELSKRQEMQPFEIRRKEKRILHFLIYFIESGYDFTGSGVFAKQHPTPNPILS